MRGDFYLRLVGSFPPDICLSLGRYFSNKQKEGLLNSVLYRSLEWLDIFSMVIWRGLNQLVLLNVLPPPPMEIGSLGGLP